MSPYDPAEDPFADPRQSIGYLARICFRSFSRALEKRTAPYGVSSGQWRFLRVLWQEDGLTQRELSRRVGMREPTTVVALRKLEQGGLVRRETSTEDRRKIHVFLTEAARALQGVLSPYVAEVNAIATTGLTATEIQTLKRLMEKVAGNLADEAAGEGGADA
jgi:DNA-binding MarR family transcriptional regulator